MAADRIVQYAFATPSGSGTTVLVPAQAGQVICVLQVCVITSQSNNVKFQSGGSTDLSALFPLAPNGGFVLPFSQIGWMQTLVSESLTFNQTGGVTTAVQIVWCPHTL